MAQEARAPFKTMVGLIRRRILLNYAADEAVVQKLLPPPFRPKLHNGKAVVGVCLIRLEQVRPRGFPARCGLSSENAAHRIAVEWTDETDAIREGVYIPRRDTGSWLNHLAGGRLFPGEHHRAKFHVEDSDEQIDLKMHTADKHACVELAARVSTEIGKASIFSSTEEASRFFEGGCDGFSPRIRSTGMDGMRLTVEKWVVKPLEVLHATSALFTDETIFPQGSICLDHALLMKDVSHNWQPVEVPIQ